MFAKPAEMPSSLTTDVVPQIRVAHATGDHERAATLRRQLLNIEACADGVRKATEDLDHAVVDAYALGLSVRDVAQATGGLYSCATVRRICRIHAGPGELEAAWERESVQV